MKPAMTRFFEVTFPFVSVVGVWKPQTKLTLSLLLPLTTGASQDLRSPQLPYLKYDTWGCERKPADLDVLIMENEALPLNL